MRMQEHCRILLIGIGPLPWQSGEVKCTPDERLGGIEAQLKGTSVTRCSPQPSSLPFLHNLAALREQFLRYGAQPFQEQSHQACLSSRQ